MTSEPAPLTIAVIGLGYVGCVSAGCLGEMGHCVIGVDVNETKVRLINEGLPTIVEKGIADLIAKQRRAGRLSATGDLQSAAKQSDVCLICVGTPSDRHGKPDLTYMWKVAEQIRGALAGRERFLTIVVRSTTPPGTCDRLEAILAESGKRAGEHFAVVSNPEFLREGTSIEDYFHPPYTLLGTSDRTALSVLTRMYGGIDAPIVETTREIGEMIKYVNNSYHALKVVFANEIGAICGMLGIDPHPLMELFCRDRQLNISPAYLKPGFAYGGSCLPKDLRALNALARSLNVDVSVLSSVERSNASQIDRAFQLIAGVGRVRVGILGLAFKPGTDDLRESPIVKLLERLIGKGYEVRIHDRNVAASRLMGANKEYMESTAPHLIQWMEPDLAELKQFADCFVIAQKNEEYLQLMNEVVDTKTVIDLVRISDAIPVSPNYKGLVW